MRNWSPLQLGLLAVAGLVFVAVAVLGVLALQGDGPACTEGTRSVDQPVDRPPEEALAEFLGFNPDTYPLEGWEVVSNDDGVTVFRNDDGGDFEIEVESGVVRRFERCEV